MSWKGFAKAVSRLPHQISSMAGYSETTVDQEFQNLNTQFEEFFNLNKKLFDDAQKFKDSFSIMLDHQFFFAETLAQVLEPIENGESSKGRKETPKQAERACALERAMQQARETLKPDLEVIEQRVIAPVIQLLQILENVKRHIAKRQHKLLDYDRHRDSAKSMATRTDRDAKDEKKLGQLETDFDAATREYMHINNTLKQEIPILLGLKSSFMDPLFQTLYWYQLKVYSQCQQLFQRVVHLHFDPSVPASLVFSSKADEMTALLASLTIIKRPLNRNSNGAPSPDSVNPTATNVMNNNRLSSQSYSNQSPPVYTDVPNAIANNQSAAKNFTPSPVSMGNSFAEIHGSAAPPPFNPSPSTFKMTGDYVIALYDFQGQNEDDLSFRRDDHIEILEKTNSTNDWWKGRINGRVGMFPANYVSKI